MSNPDSFETLVSLAYGELRGWPDHSCGNQRPGHTLQNIALVHEGIFVRVVATDFESRALLLWSGRTGDAASVDRTARAHNATKRAGAVRRVTFGDLAVQAEDPDLDLFCVDEALSALEALDSRLCRIIELRYFAGLTLEEIAELTGTSVATVKRDGRMPVRGFSIF